MHRLVHRYENHAQDADRLREGTVFGLSRFNRGAANGRYRRIVLKKSSDT